MSKEALCMALFVLLTALPVSTCMAGADEVTWHEATEFQVDGRGWTDTESPYDRLPAKAKGTVPESVWGLSRQSAGLSVRFKTSARTVQVRWELTSDNLAMPHMPATGVSGIDLYRKAADKTWRFVQNGRPTQRAGNLMTAGLPASRTGQTECLLYLPLYNGVKSVEIGVPAGATIEKAADHLNGNRRPLVYYGTSIAQGGCASRPGMAHVGMLGRLLDRPMINLGFSGSGRMEPAVSRLLAELDPEIYVIDCLWNIGNMPEPEFTLRVTTLIETIRHAHPTTPILFVGQSRIQSDQPVPAMEQLQDKIVKRMLSRGVTGLSLCPGKKLLGSDGDGTVDGVHPNDLGMRRQADALAPVLANILRTKAMAAR